MSASILSRTRPVREGDAPCRPAGRMHTHAKEYEGTTNQRHSLLQGRKALELFLTREYMSRPPSILNYYCISFLSLVGLFISLAVRLSHRTCRSVYVAPHVTCLKSVFRFSLENLKFIEAVDKVYYMYVHVLSFKKSCLWVRVRGD